MGSARLPGKVLMKIGDRPLLGHIVTRLGRLRIPKCQTVVAASTKVRDDVIEKFCMETGVACFRGDEKNVLERYWQCILHYGFDDVVRLTADNPFIDIEELARLIELHRSSGADFSYSDTELPEGTGAEMFSRKALEQSIKRAYKENHFEHVDDYILENMDQFACRKLDLDRDKIHPELSFTVDTAEEWEKACFIAEHASDIFFSTREAICLEKEYRKILLL